ncbi:MAG: hypothetical protein L0229_18645 [Blastocatellia bacterium]|nr:hypothetical protein [Blastocatellia bacterium]
MATEALTLVARRVGCERVSSPQVPGHSRGWREILAEEDAEAIWQRLFTLIESAVPNRRDDCDLITQEIFLHLLATQRLNLYLTEGRSDEEIESDLLSLVSE